MKIGYGSGWVMRKPFEELRLSGSKACRFCPSEPKAARFQASLLCPSAKQRGIPRGYDHLVAGRFEASEKGRQRKRWKGEREAVPPPRSLSSPFGRGTMPAQPSNGFLPTQPPSSMELSVQSLRVFETPSLILFMVLFYGIEPFLPLEFSLEKRKTTRIEQDGEGENDGQWMELPIENINPEPQGQDQLDESDGQYLEERQCQRLVRFEGYPE